MLTEREYREKREQYGQAFKAAMGAEAVKQLLDNVDLDGEVAQLKEELKTASGQKRTRAIRRLDILEAFRASGNQPSWMVMDVIQVRSVIEPLAIKLAMKHATDQDREALREIHQQTLKAVDSGDFIKLGQYDEAFHAHIIECSQNKMLISINKQISDFLKNFRGKTFRIPNNVQNIVPAHTSILNAFLEGDTEKAGKCMAAHMEQIMVDLESSKDYEMKQ